MNNKTIKICSVLFILCFALVLIVNIIRTNNIKFEYFKGGNIGISPQCYLNDKDKCMCKIGNDFEYVDGYYEVEK